MRELQIAVTVFLIVVGLLLMLLGSIGLIRLPDFYSRTHAASKVDTLGIIIVLLGMAAWEGFTLTGAKLVVAMLFVGFSNPVAAHALARAALWQGVKPWRHPRDNGGEEAQ